MAVGIRKREKDGDKPTPTRAFSSRQEKAVAKAVNGHTTANSGATTFSGKGDVQTDGGEGFLIECKTKTKPSESITIKKEWFSKNREEMAFEGKKHQTVVFNFGPDEENHYIIDEYLFLFLLDCLNENR